MSHILVNKLTGAGRMFLAGALLLMASVASGQDLIVKKDGTTINCFVTKTDSARIYYNLKNKTVVTRSGISRSEVSTIRYGVVTPSGMPGYGDTGEQTQPPVRLIQGYATAGFTFPVFGGEASAYALDIMDAMKYNTGLEFDMRIWPRLFTPGGGAGVRVNINRWLALNIGVEFVPKGIKYHGKYNRDGVDYSLDMTYKVDYLEVPFSVQLSSRLWNNTDATYFYLKGGVAPSFMVMSRYRFVLLASNGSDSDYDLETNRMEGANDNELSRFITLGTGFSSKTALELRYEWGNEPVFDPETAGYTFYNRAVSLSLVYTF